MANGEASRIGTSLTAGSRMDSYSSCYSFNSSCNSKNKGGISMQRSHNGMVNQNAKDTFVAQLDQYSENAAKHLPLTVCNLTLR